MSGLDGIGLSYTAVTPRASLQSDAKNYQSHNMILMSKYKEQHGGKKGKQIRARPSPPPFSGNARKKSIFLMGGVPLGDK